MSIEAMLKQRKERTKPSDKASDSEGEEEKENGIVDPPAGLPMPDNFRRCLLERQTSVLSNEV